MAELNGHLLVSIRRLVLKPTSTIHLHSTASSPLAASDDAMSSQAICNDVHLTRFVFVCDVCVRCIDSSLKICFSTKRYKPIIKVVTAVSPLIASNLFYKRTYVNVNVYYLRVLQDNRVRRYKWNKVLDYHGYGAASVACSQA